MAITDDDPRIQQRMAQLDDIVTRRNECLRELYTLLHWKPDSEHMLVNFEPEDDGVKAFLQRFDIKDSLDQGSISHINEDEVARAFQTPLHALQQPSVSTVDLASKSTRATRSRARAEPVASTAAHKPPSSSGLDKKRQQRVTTDEDHDELDVIGSGPASDDESVRVRPTKAPSVSVSVDVASPIPLKKESTDVPIPQPPTPPTPAIPVGDAAAAVAKEDKMDVDAGAPQGTGREISIPVKTEVKGENVAMDVDQPKPQSHQNQAPSQPASIPSVAPNPPEPPTTVAPSQLVSRPAMNIPVPSTPTASSLSMANGVANLGPRFLEAGLEAQKRTWVPRVPFQPNYTLPPISVLPPEFTRKAKNNRKRRDRDKDKEKDKDSKQQQKDDVLPLGINRWAATLASNPVYKRLGRSQKCLSTKDWNIGLAELRFIRATEKIEALKQKAQWSMRQPKKQRGVGGLQKTHWDYLLDEMKWMRIDFREERRWKLAVAYSLSTRVLEWHAAKTPEERVRLGITVKWKFEPKDGGDVASDDRELNGDMDADAPADAQAEAEAEAEAEEKVGPSLVGVDYGSDDEDEEEQDKQQSPMDNMETSAVEDSLNASEAMAMKNEDLDDDSALKALPMAHDGDHEMADGTVDAPDASQPSDPLGLKATSNNPMLDSKSSSPNAEPEPPSSTKPSSKSAFAPLRTKILHSADEDLFFNFADESGDGHGKVEIPDLTSLFPDLPPYTLLDVASPTPLPEGKKKAEKRSDRDDPNKRVEDTTYTKIYPKGKFMFTKPTLLGPLQPVKRWKDGKWLPTEDSQVMSDIEAAPTRGQHQDEDKFDLFDGRSTTAGSSSNFALQASSKGSRKADHTWTPADDALLKSLIDRFSTNWNLVADCFNSSRLTTPMDRRSAWDCYERWREKWGSERKPNLVDVVVNMAADDSAATTSGSVGVGVASASQMQTRKRMSSSAGTTSPVQPGPGTGGTEKGGSLSSSEAKKRRRHLMLADTIRRYHKKRAEAAQKAAASARKSTGMHDSHQQFNKLPRYTPAELSRMKAERDAAEVARKRQDEQTRLQMLAHQQQNRLNGVPAAAAGTPGQAAAPPAGGQAAQNTPPAVPAATTSGGTPVPVQAGQAAPASAPANAGLAATAVASQAALAQAAALTPQQQQQLMLQMQVAAQQRNPVLAAQLSATRARMVAAAAASGSGSTAGAGAGAVPRPAVPQQMRGLQMPTLGSASNGQAAGSPVANGGFYSLNSQEHQQLLLQIALAQQAAAAQQAAQQQLQGQGGGGGVVGHSE